MTSPKPIRILQVFGGMNRGGAETAFMEFLRQMDRTRFQMDFLVHTTRHCDYDDEIRALGSQIVPCPHPHQPLLYSRNLKNILRTKGPYDILHSHVGHFSGYVLRVGAQCGVRGRIAQSHSEMPPDSKWIRPTRRLYRALTEHWMKEYATLSLAVSAGSAAALFGGNWRADTRVRVLHNGINLTPYRFPADRAVVRDEWGISRDAIVVGHVGSFLHGKNHAFMVEIFACLLQQVPSAHLVLAGVGPEMSRIQELAQAKGIAEHVHLLGLRSDVPRILAAMDVFLFPSLYEGLPVAVQEAQAAGLPCVLSDTVSREVDLRLGLVQFLALDAGTEIWVGGIKTGLLPDKPGWQERERALRDCEFDIEQQVLQLQTIYENAAI